MDDDLKHKWSTVIAVKGRSVEVNKRAKSEKSDGKDQRLYGIKGGKGGQNEWGKEGRGRRRE